FVERRREGRLRRDQRKNPGGPQTVHIQANAEEAADHAGDTRNLVPTDLQGFRQIEAKTRFILTGWVVRRTCFTWRRKAGPSLRLTRRKFGGPLSLPSMTFSRHKRD